MIWSLPAASPKRGVLKPFSGARARTPVLRVPAIAMSRARAAIGIAVLLSCAACATQRMAMYPGSERPSSAVATLSGSTHRLVLVFYNRTTEIRILAVDEHEIIAADELALLPGHHVVKAAYGTWRSILWGLGWVRPPLPPQTIEFVGEPGHRYRVDGQIVSPTPDSREFVAWIENLDTGAVVGGSKPSP